MEHYKYQFEPEVFIKSSLGYPNADEPIPRLVSIHVCSMPHYASALLRPEISIQLNGLWIPIAAGGSIEVKDVNLPAYHNSESIAAIVSSAEYVQYGDGDREKPQRVQVHVESKSINN